MNKQQRKQYHGPPGSKALSIVQSHFPAVEKIVDAKKPLRVTVTKSDNDNAQVKEHGVCALAVACKRATKADGVIIGISTSYVIRGKVAHRYQNRATTSREITSFDRKAGFDTGEYVLVPKARAHQLGVYKPGGPHIKKLAKDRRKFKHFTRGVRTVLGEKLERENH